MSSFVLTVDVEPVPRLLKPGLPPSWEGLDFIVERLERFREVAAERTGQAARFSWFVRVDPQIEAACGDAAHILLERLDLFRALESKGDAIGLHFHDYRWLPERDSWISDHANRTWIDRSLAQAFAAFQSAWGTSPRIFRYGDRWMDDATMAKLEELGVKVDLTVEPGSQSIPPPQGELASSNLPEMRRAPRHPYVPARADFRRGARLLERKRHLWEVPVCVGCVNGEPFPRKLYPAHVVVPMNLGLDPRWVSHVLPAAVEERLPVITTVARSGDLAREGTARFFEENLQLLESMPSLDECRFMTPEEAVREMSGYNRGR